VEGPPDAVQHGAALGGGGLAPAGMNLLKLKKKTPTHPGKGKSHEHAQRERPGTAGRTKLVRTTGNLGL
jgi:hypothetical protein